MIQPRVNGKFSPIPFEIRFWARIEKTETCWLWTGSKVSGYGQIWVDGTSKRAHILSYKLFKGEIPENMELDHLCRVRDCVNPDHLEAVTPSENIKRMIPFRRRRRTNTELKVQLKEYMGNDK